jgi:hypothetical protein
MTAKLEAMTHHLHQQLARKGRPAREKMDHSQLGFLEKQGEGDHVLAMINN